MCGTWSGPADGTASTVVRELCEECQEAQRALEVIASMEALLKAYQHVTPDIDQALVDRVLGAMAIVKAAA